MIKKIAFLISILLAPIPLLAQGQWNLSSTSTGWTWSNGTQSFGKLHLLSIVDQNNYLSDAGSVCGSGGTQSCIEQLCVKYGGTWTGSCSSWTAFGVAVSDRMKNSGFNGAGYYSNGYISAFTSGNLPYTPSADYGQYATQDSAGGGAGPFHVKNAAFVQTQTGMKCGTYYYNGGSLGSGPLTPDPYDPEFPTAFAALYAANISNTGMPNALFQQSLDGDSLWMIDQVSWPGNGHPDGGLEIASMDPVVTTSAPVSGGGYSYPNKTYFAKEALCNAMLAKYGTLAAWNAAWHTSFTTVTTSDSGGTTGIANGTYASYGTGTGCLDEAGFDLVASGQSCGGLSGNGPQQNESWGAYAQIQLDIDGWMATGFAAQLATELWNAYYAACTPNCSPLSFPVYAGPVSPLSSSVYAGMASALTGHPILFWVAPAAQTSTGNFASVVQNILNADGNTPVVVGHYFVSQPDSFIETPGACSGYEGGPGIDCQNTQALRGSNWVSAMSAVFPLKCPNGKYCVVGDEQWSLWDQYNYANFGLWTVNDNAYDGSSASTATSGGSCTTSHSYTSAAICTDGNGNTESLATSSCTSGTMAPTWPSAAVANYGKQTVDGTCTWLDDFTYTRYPEQASYGNALLPIANFNLSHLSDPTSGSFAVMSVF